MGVWTTSEELHGMVKKATMKWELTTTGTTSGQTTHHYDGRIYRVVLQDVTSADPIALIDEDDNDMFLGVGVLTTGDCYLLPSTDALNNRLPESVIANSRIKLQINATTTDSQGTCYIFVR